jgi:N-acetylneuraminic acid mutarotase
MIFNTESLSLYMHGGMDINNEALNDMWIFSLETSAWSKVYQKGQIPAPRSGHSLVKHDNSIILFGGLLEVTKETEDLYQFDLSKNVWLSHTKHV